MALAEAPLAAAVDDATGGPSRTPDVLSQESDLTNTTLSSSTPGETDGISQQTPANNATRSLFGPFPLSEMQTSTAASQPPPTTTDQIESSQENRRDVNQPSSPALNYNSQAREPLAAIQPNKSAGPSQPSPPPLTREKTIPAIGPATDKPTPVPKESEIEGPVLFITLLLSSTGARHPYKLDEKYLRKRNVVVEGNNPINLSLYKLKELILRDWREGKKIF